MQEEIDTHLSILHVDVNDRYADTSSTTTALNRMRSEFEASTWHHPNTDIHHALLGNPMGGGKAYVGVLCNSWYGYGVSASLRGNYGEITGAVVW